MPEFKIHLSDKSSCFVYEVNQSREATGSVTGCMGIKVWFLFWGFLLKGLLPMLGCSKFSLVC